MKILLAATLAAVALMGTVRAQTPPPPAAGPHLSEVEKLKIENLQLKFTQLTQQMQAAQAEQQKLGEQYRALISEVEKEHPGFTVGASGDLAPKPKEAPKPEVKK